jgi:hypothetical protein
MKKSLDRETISLFRIEHESGDSSNRIYNRLSDARNSARRRRLNADEFIIKEYKFNLCDAVIGSHWINTQKKC